MDIKEDKGRIHQVLKHYFGYNSFRAQQEQIINTILEGQDTVVLMPTGGGKSICYQLPSLVLEGLTLVISPLIALMKDQVERLNENGIKAAFINSSLPELRRKEIEHELEEGLIKLLYVSPEKVFASDFLSFLSLLNIRLIAVDEAHCVSSWGHHFRPEYKKLHFLKKKFPQASMVALTATADKAVRSDIGRMLGMQSPRMFTASFDRPNLSLSVLPGQKKWEQIKALLQKYTHQSGIIYCSSRKATEQLAQKIKSLGRRAACYHAGLPNPIKDQCQNAFLQGDIDIICATVAFGMGIDKPDIRFVIHYNMPGNLESYYQEIGRAGRDGKPADTILFYSYRDVQTQLSFTADITDPQYRDIQIAKLNRMQAYAEALICRRKIMLSYFAETLENDCGNCDVCKNPPKFIDGIIPAQKVLSAIARTQQQLSLPVLVDVLRGFVSNAVKEHNYQSIKTFGAGKSKSPFVWQLYIQQLLQQGALEIDYKDANKLKLNTFSLKILKGDATVKLVPYEIIKERQEAQKNKQQFQSIDSDNQLYECLRSLRKTMADAIGKPAFVIFNNASLMDMSAKAPTNLNDFMLVNGVGKHKAKRYGKQFIAAIIDFKRGA